MNNFSNWHFLDLWPVRDGICQCYRKATCSAPGKHPLVNGRVDGPPNRGVFCAASGFLALDIDLRNGGFETLSALEAELGALPVTVEQNTGGGGKHFLFRLPALQPGNKFRGELGPGVDVKAQGYIVVSPSVHASGKRYQWQPGRGPLDIEMNRLPAQWFARLVHSTPSPAAHGARLSGLKGEPENREARIKGFIQKMRPLGAGGRNRGLESVAGYLVSLGWTGDWLLEDLDKINHAVCSPPLEMHELAIIATSVGRYS